MLEGFVEYAFDLLIDLGFMLLGVVCWVVCFCFSWWYTVCMLLICVILGWLFWVMLCCLK